MELVCIDKQTFEELRIRFCKFEERMTHICRPVEDLGLKTGWTTRKCAMCSASTKRLFRHIGPKGYFPSAV